MKAIYVFCEGQTEQEFCNRILFPHLMTRGFLEPHTIRVAHSRRHGIVARGGLTRYLPLRNDIRNQLKGRAQSDVVFTTMIDLYALPGDFPGKQEMQRDPANPSPFVEALEQAFRSDINDPRFVPYIQLHEFETLLFADPDAFGLIGDHHERAIAELRRMVEAFPSIEHIDDGPDTAPSKRIKQLFPKYNKALHGPEIAEYIGLEALRRTCPHFDTWIGQLERHQPPGHPIPGAG